MALTAIAQDQSGSKTLITPFKMVESSGVMEATDVYQSIEAEKQRGIRFYCADCYLDRQQLIDVVFRRTDARKVRPHFAHIGAAGGCVGTNPETVKHRTAKTLLATYLQEKGGRVEVEYTLNTGQAQMRRPDVFAEFVDRVEAHEVQVSPINGAEITQRTNDLLAHLKHRFPDHVAMVYWYLAPRNQKPDNWGRFNFVDRHGLILDFDKETGAPVWQSYQPHFEADKELRKLEAAEKQQKLEKQRKREENTARWRLKRSQQSKSAISTAPSPEVISYQKDQRQQEFQRKVQNAQAWYKDNRQRIIDAIASAPDQQLQVAPHLKMTPLIVDRLDSWETQLEEAQNNLVACYYLRPLRLLRQAISTK